MVHIIVSDQQAKLIADTGQYVEIRDQHGNHLGFIAHGFTEQDIAIAKDRFASDQPRLSTKQMVDRLRCSEAE